MRAPRPARMLPRRSSACLRVPNPYRWSPNDNRRFCIAKLPPTSRRRTTDFVCEQRRTSTCDCDQSHLRCDAALPLRTSRLAACRRSERGRARTAHSNARTCRNTTGLPASRLPCDTNTSAPANCSMGTRGAAASRRQSRLTLCCLHCRSCAVTNISKRGQAAGSGG